MSGRFTATWHSNPGPSLTIQVVDPEGKPLTQRIGLGTFPDNDHGDHKLYDQSQAEIVGLDPASPRTVVFLHVERKLGAVLVDQAQRRGPGPASAMSRSAPVRPSPGRIVDAEGKPVTGGIWVYWMPEDGDLFAAREYSWPGPSMPTAGSGSTTWPPAGSIRSRPGIELDLVSPRA